MSSARATLVNAVYRASLKPILLRERDVERLRRHLNRFSPLAGSPPRETEIEVVDLGSFTAERITARGSSQSRHVLYFPGGGFVLRSASIHRPLAARLSRETGAPVLLCFYRLAPEHPFPAALEDCIAAYRHLLDSGVEPSDIVVGGDSAGGCLVLASLIALRDEGATLPAGAFMLCPVTDLRDHRDGSRTSNRDSDSMLTMDSAEILHRHYVGGSEAALSDPLVSPQLGDLSGLPPLLFHTSSSEILLDDSVRAAERARAAGVECELEVFDGVPHVWHAIPSLPESKRALAAVGAFTRRSADRARKREEEPCTTPT